MAIPSVLHKAEKTLTHNAEAVLDKKTLRNQDKIKEHDIGKIESHKEMQAGFYRQ